MKRGAFDDVFGEVHGAGHGNRGAGRDQFREPGLGSIDPIWTTAYITRNHGYMVYDTLFAMDKDLVPQPQMVDKYEVSADKLKYTFTLRDGLKWHDGAPVRSAD